MKNIKSLIRIASVSLAFACTSGAQAQGVNLPASMGTTTIVQAFDAAPGKSSAEVYKAMQNMVNAIRKMPGLVDDVVLENKNPANKPSHVHVMRWRDQKSWELIFSNAEFQKAIKENSSYFVIDAAGIFTPVK